MTVVCCPVMSRRQSLIKVLCASKYFRKIVHFAIARRYVARQFSFTHFFLSKLQAAICNALTSSSRLSRLKENLYLVSDWNLPPLSFVFRSIGRTLFSPSWFPFARGHHVKTLSWFESKISRPAALRGLSIELELVGVDNRIKKPGPVFTAVTKVRVVPLCCPVRLALDGLTQVQMPLAALPRDVVRVWIDRCYVCSVRYRISAETGIGSALAVFWRCSAIRILGMFFAYDARRSSLRE